MGTEDLKRSWLMSIFLLGAILFLTMGCYGNMNSEGTDAGANEGSEAEEPEHTEIVITSPESFEEDLKKVFPGEISPQLIAQMKNRVFETMHNASGKNKEKLYDIVKYFESIEENPSYLDSQANRVKLLETLAEANAIAAEIEPDNFNVNYPVAQNYLYAARSIENFLDPSDEHKRLSNNYKQKAFQAAKELVKKFPNEAKAYSQYAYLSGIVEGDKKKVLELYKRCLEIDPEMESCRTCYDDLKEDLKN